MRIAIIGGGPSWARAPFDDPQWETWSHSSSFEGIPKADRWFEVHTPEVRAGGKAWSGRYREWLTDPAAGRVGQVWVLDGFPPSTPDVPTVENADIFNAAVIPRWEIQRWVETHGAAEQEYVTSTAAWMFKLALYECAAKATPCRCEFGHPHGVDCPTSERGLLKHLVIGIWGINYDEHAEYIVQRPCMEYWIAFARALGVIVYITPTSRLCRDKHVYGFDGARPDLVHTNRPFRDGFHRLSLREALAPVPVPKSIQDLIDEEKVLFGIDTEAMWAEAAAKR